jgi:hypothetical protein
MSQARSLPSAYPSFLPAILIEINPAPFTYRYSVFNFHTFIECRQTADKEGDMTAQNKEKLIELFDFARRRIIQSMELRHCPHAGFYNSVDERCIHCHQGMECVWMNHNDELVTLEEKTEEQLKQQLLIAVDFVDSNLSPYHWGTPEH